MSKCRDETTLVILRYTFNISLEQIASTLLLRGYREAETLQSPDAIGLKPDVGQSVYFSSFSSLLHHSDISGRLLNATVA